MQKFVVPAGATSLSLWYDDVCTGSVASNDYVTVTLRDNSIGHTTTILAKTCSNTGSFVQVVVSLSGYANHKATLELISHDDAATG